ncbi:DNA-directed RNA polymerase subunit D [Candidatus Woesearchaeota archaeon]|nr:DNA-directed RNA polymerase subunit D [Candidatus Woesearchaeota archaeon]
MIPAGKKEESEAGEFRNKPELPASTTTMEVRLLTKDKKTGAVSFLMKDATAAFANTLRRAIIHDVPTMAIEKVTLTKNSSVLYDEMIAHRLGLIPLSTDLKTYNVCATCTCTGAGCAKCACTLTLSAKGPGIVLASQIKSADPKVIPVYPDMPIVKLLKGQELELEATALLGTGADHIKWAPGLAWYKYKPVVEILNNPADPKHVADGCPAKVFDVKNGKLLINKDNYLNCNLSGECVERSGGDVKLNEKDTEFVFFVEPFGQLPADEMVSAALSALQSKVTAFSGLLKA